MGTLRVLEDSETEPQVRQLRMFSPAIGRQVGATVLTPAGWCPGSHGGHPVVYLLHGASDDHTSWIRHTDVVRLAADSTALVVMPEAGRLGFYTDWQVPDRQATVPKWETFHLNELPPLLEHAYGASQRRIVAGISMGGYGALRYAAARPGMFRAAGSLSGLMHITRAGMAALLGFLALREGMRLGQIWGPRARQAENWAAHDPCVHADRLTETNVYLAAGDGTRVDGEEFVPGMGLIERYARRMSEDLAGELADLGAGVSTNFSTGTHFWTTWRRGIAEFWPYATRMLEDRPSAENSEASAHS